MDMDKNLYDLYVNQDKAFNDDLTWIIIDDYLANEHLKDECNCDYQLMMRLRQT